MASLLTPRDTTDATVNRWKFNRRATEHTKKTREKLRRRGREGERERGRRSKAEDRMGCITSTPAVAPIEVVVRVHEREFSCTYSSPDGRSAWGSVFGRCCTDHQSARFCLYTIVVPPPPPHTQSGVFETWGAGAPSLRSVELDLRLARRFAKCRARRLPRTVGYVTDAVVSRYGLHVRIQ